MKKKYSSLVIIFFIYVVATIIGIYVFNMLSSNSLIVRLIIADITATVFIWIIGLILKNASLYDPYWSVAPPLILILTHIHLGTGVNTLQFFIYAGVLIWSIRLTYNWMVNWTGFEEQDWRYTLIKEKAPKLYLISNLFGIHLMPTIIVFIQLIGAIELFQLTTKVNLLTMIGLFIMISSAIIQFISDKQMRDFKTRTKEQKQCIEEGLWKYSRHPNYFGEIMVWWGLYLIYFGATSKLNLILIAPFLMTALFIFISIPMMEKKILKTRPEYSDYQKRVSMLFPFFRNEHDQELSESA